MIEVIPNISEGRRLNVIQTFVKSVSAIDGIHFLDHSSDPSHHRSVFTFAGNSEAVHEAAMELARLTVGNIDLRKHEGVHPRLGALDVLPLVPLGNTPIQECLNIAHSIGEAVAKSFNIPIFMYEMTASSEHRRRLEQIRKGGLQHLTHKISDSKWKPDYGPSQPHPTAGISVIGVRHHLIALNINLHTDDVQVAQRIAKKIRASNGGLPDLKALGLCISNGTHSGAQVSMNLTNYRRTSIKRVVETVVQEANNEKVPVAGTEFIGLIPWDAIKDNADTLITKNIVRKDQIIEVRLGQQLPETDLIQSDSASRTHNVSRKNDC